MASKVFFPDGLIVDISGQAPSPSKDFCQVQVTQDAVIFRWWKILPPTRNDSNVPPIEYKDTYEDFIYDDRMHSEIERVFGAPTLEYLKAVVNGHPDYITRLSPDILKRIILKLELEDINRLGQTNKLFRELCKSDGVWEQIYRLYSETPVTKDLQNLAAEEGWKQLFFTNKLQLQRRIRKQMRKQNEGNNGTTEGRLAFLTE
ncbi:F-box only protein 36-like [Liolophura sinensis]|uniref:F-box only protein 36-like n=1 Tax=Liolophura sinensis TaxID=3198878 RepID=UPI003159931C